VGLILDPGEVVRLARTDAPMPLPVKAEPTTTA